MKIECPNCQMVFHPRIGRETDYCCLNCVGESRWKPYLECVKCHAYLGLGYRASGEVMGVGSSVIQRIRKKKAIIAALQTNTGWAGVKTEIHLEQERQKELYAKYERAWMKHEVRCHKKDCDWSIIWSNEKARRDMRARYQAMTPEEKKEWNRRSSARNPTRRKAYQQQWKAKKRREDPVWRMLEGMRARLSNMVRNANIGGNEALVGCTRKQLRAHLESQFTKRMTWDNYGRYWHVDHILPCASFDHSVSEQVKQCWHWTNLAPLEASKNLEKSDTITSPQMSLLLCSTH